MSINPDRSPPHSPIPPNPPAGDQENTYAGRAVARADRVVARADQAAQYMLNARDMQKIVSKSFNAAAFVASALNKGNRG